DICDNLQDSNVNWDGVPANCSRCMRYICNNHGGVDTEGNIWCADCAKEHNAALELNPIPVLAVDPAEDEPCTGCENGCDGCVDPLMATYAGCYHKDGTNCDCAEEYRKHQVWTYSGNDSDVCTCSNCLHEAERVES